MLLLAKYSHSGDEILYQQHVIYTNPKLNIHISTGCSSKKTVHSYMHFHSSLEFLYILSGSYLCHINNDDVLVNKGEVIFFNSRTPHATESTTDDATECIMLQFDNPLKLHENTKFLPLFIEKNTIPYYHFKKNDENTKILTDLIMTAYIENKNTDIAHDYIIAAKKFEIIAFLYRTGFITDPEHELLQNKNILRIMPIVEFIEENFKNIISLDDISNVLHMNKNYLCKIFKTATGKTIMDYLNFTRVENAKELIKSGLTISEVSSSVGFSSQSYFNKVFQKYILCTPSEYKKRFLDNRLNNF